MAPLELRYSGHKLGCKAPVLPGLRSDAKGRQLSIGGSDLASAQESTTPRFCRSEHRTLREPEITGQLEIRDQRGNGLHFKIRRYAGSGSSSLEIQVRVSSQGHCTSAQARVNTCNYWRQLACTKTINTRFEADLRVLEPLHKVKTKHSGSQYGCPPTLMPSIYTSLQCKPASARSARVSTRISYSGSTPVHSGLG